MDNQQTVQQNQQEQKPQQNVQNNSNPTQQQPPAQPQTQSSKTEDKAMPNQSNLLESKVIPPEEKPIDPINNFDEVPIGGGQKFNFSEFPQQGDGSKVAPVVKKKPVTKKSVKCKPNLSQEPTQQRLQQQQKPSQSVQNFGNDQVPLPKPNTTNINPMDQVPVGGGNNSQFMSQQVPINPQPLTQNTFNISEFPQGQSQPAVEKEYPMLQKLKSKAVKLRFSGMEDLIKLLQENPQDPDINQVQIKPLVKQTTPANLEKGLQVLKLWIEKGRKWGDDEVKNAIENGMAKVNTKKLTVDICDLMYDQNPNTVETAILLGLKGKIPKTIAYYLTIISQLLAIYGIKRMKYLKPYMPDVVKLINDKKDIAIKNQGSHLIKETFKWMGKQVVNPMISDLKQNIKKQIQAFWDTYDKETVMKAPKGQQAEQGAQGKKKKKVDAYDISEAVDIFKKYNQKWSQSVLSAAKWSQKTKMLEQFFKAASVPKLANTQFRHISQMIKRLINDSNFNVVIWTLRVLAVLSRGLRRHFYHVVKQVFSNVLAKFRDKKTIMVDETFNTLNDFLYVISIEEVLDDVKQGLQDKAPNMKVNLINWIGKFVQIKAEDKGEIPEKALQALKSLFPIFEKLLNDGTVEVRECMARNVFKMKITISDEFFAPLEAKMSKNLADKAEKKVEKTVKQTTSKKQNSKEKDLSKSSVSFNKAKQKQNQRSMSRTQIISTKKQEKKPSQPQLKLQRFEPPQFEDCCVKLVENGFPQQQIKNIKVPGAKQRQNVLNLIKDGQYGLLSSFVVLRQLFKDWKQVNLLMNKELASFIEQKSSQIDKSQLVVIIPYIVEKIGDSKFSEVLYRSLENICSKIPGTFVVGYLIETIRSYDNKKPKLNSDVCICITKIIDFVSCTNIPVRESIIYANQCYKVQFSKKGATELLKKIYSHIGEQIKIYLEADTYGSLEGQFKKTKVLSEEQKKPKIQFSGQAKKAQKTSVNLLENKPKVDITGQVQNILPKMNDNTSWQNRKQSAQILISLINQNFGRVTIACMSDLMNSVKMRINDSNKHVIKVFMQLTGLLFAVLSDKDLRIHTKTFVLALADGLSDKMQANKKQAALTLNKIGEVIGKQHLLTLLAPYLQSDKESRIEIISIMLSNAQYLTKADTKDFPKGITNCLCDKNKDIRNSAQKLFQKVYEKIGIEIFRNIAKNQRPVIAKDLNAIYDKYDKSPGSQSFISKANSPNKQSRVMDRRNPPPSVSAKKRSLSKTQKQQRSTVQIQDDLQNISSLNNNSRVGIQPVSQTQIQARFMIQNGQYFAPLKYLTNFRVERQQNPNAFNQHWLMQELRQEQEDNLKQQINLLMSQDLAKKMFSFNPRRVNEAVMQLIRLCKEITYQNHFRQLYDLLLKWTLMRLWGGSPSLLSIIQVFPPILSILQKKKLVLNQFQVQLIITVLRQYFISSFLNEFKVSDSLHTIMKSLIGLSSGQRVLRKLLRQFSFDVTTLHRHLKKDVNLFYRDGLLKLTKMHLMEFIGHEDMLEEAAKINQLRSDQEFVDILYKKFHETVLNSFGFRKLVSLPTTNQPPLPPSHQQTYQTHPTKSTGLPRRERSVSNDSRTREKSNQKEKNRVGSSSRITSVRPQAARNNYVQSQQSISSLDYNHKINSNYDHNKPQSASHKIYASDIDLSIYPAPHPISPLGKHLSKLTPPNDQTIKFFTQLFNENSQKITNQLIAHSKIIFAAILKSVMQILQSRQGYAPEKIVNQINLLQQCIKCKHIIRNVDQLLFMGINFALRQLVYQDENKALIHEDLVNRGIDYKIENFIKVINGVMLRILQNGNPQQVVNNLIIINNEFQKTPQKSNKTIYLIMKCTSRVAQSYTSEMKLEGIVEFLIAVNEYLALNPPDVTLDQFQLPVRQKPKPEENYLNSLKLILFQMIKILNSDIWGLYERAMGQAKYQDHYISQYLKALNVPYKQKRGNSHKNSKDNEQLRKITELLAKNKTFEAGILQFKKFCQQHPDFSPVEYFTSLGYDQKFITMVVNALEGKERRTPRKGNNDSQHAKSKSPLNNEHASQQQNIQEKIKKLKQKFEQIQPGSEPQKPQSSSYSSNKRPPISGGSQDKIQAQENERNEKQQRALEIKRRIDEMKNRLNSNFDKPR